MKVAPSLAMVVVECSNVVSSILFKSASLKGLSYYIFVAYCYVLATIVFIPLVFFRKTAFPPLSFPLISRLCLVGIIGYESGLFAFSFTTTVHTWGVRLKGPVFVAIFRPTSIVISAVLSAIFLSEAIYLGSMIGAVILTIGLYAVLWGKAKEEEGMEDDECGLSRLGPSPSGRVPMLQSYKS